MSNSPTPFVSSEVETPGTVADFLLELRSEEIPARMQAGARADLEKLFRREMEAAGLAVGALTVWSTPRRLTLIARGLPLATQAVSEETKGPRTSAPEQALEGFLRKTGLTKDQLTERDGVWFAVVEKPGRAATDVLAEAIPAIIRAFPWPKSQRWGAASLQPESLRWVRPLSGIIALLGGEVVDCEIGGIRSGRTTMGHRFHHSGEITIDGVDDYAAKLRDAHVIVDHVEREGIVREGAKKAAADAGLVLVEDEGLVIENAGLTEWPVPLLGRFDEAFLEVPPEVIQLTARVNQKYFICRDSAGKLANAFVCTANIAAKDGGAMIVAGNRKVLAARLSDARFFWEQDRKTPLSVHAEKLARITFHEKLGTVADKVERVAKLAEWLASEGIVPGCDPAQARIAAELCKADLVTEMVGEFPELQGLMGGYYARAEGLPDAVADAIRDHYKPVGQGDEVPTAPVTVAVALADKLDTIVGFFGIGEQPTGSRDPYALRRAAIGVIRILQSGVRLQLARAFRLLAGEYHLQEIDREFGSFEQYLAETKSFDESGKADPGVPDPFAERFAFKLDAGPAELAFFADRLKVQQREAGVRHDLIDAVFALGDEDDLVRLLARVHALQAFVGTEDGVNLIAGYKRAANILKKEGYQQPFVSSEVETPAHGISTSLDANGLGAETEYTREPAEQALVDALDAAEPRAEAAVAAEDFTAAMAALATLRAPIDAFFESVTVNDADPAKRAGRLGLLDRFRAAVHKVADFSRIEG
ncbi:glycine--tRNA ligase subunit beta [Novosphingobium sp. NDB2Meth1]|uniref:glycine--tRNA ligase subunit beta n=1 Tax=Novosphingobium sp. NDB2Meth1 TaxID=1892847 RepID=UPI0009319ABC|nr:glycine--tRNA ligase subunit beta [Novosphingobium sp. NDB2Meth1]